MEKQTRWQTIKEVMGILWLWIVLMSSIFSVAYGLVSDFIITNVSLTDAEKHRYWLLGFGYCSLLVVTAIIWFRGKRQRIELENKIAALESNWLSFQKTQKPKFKNNCGKDIPGSVVTATVKDTTIKCRCFRVAVGVDGDRTKNIENCRGAIKSIKKNSEEKLPGDIMLLPFAPSSGIDTKSKTIVDKLPAFLDVLTISEENNVFLSYFSSLEDIPGSINLNRTFFPELGEYILTVVVSGNDTASSEFLLKFNWTGDWQTADLSLIT